MTANSHPGNILVVDDEQLNRMILTRALEAQGHRVSSVENGLRALDILREDPAAFDVVLLDMLMPELDGMQTLAELKRDARLKHLPVIIVSALDEMDSVVRCIEMGAEDYLPKPFKPVLLRARLDASLEKKRLRDQEQKYLRGLERELEIGREIQRSFLPADLPRVAGWELAAKFQPARQVAGDFYDAFEMQNGARLAVVIGDVADKGVGAALFMALFRSLLRAFAEHSAAPLSEVVSFANDYIARTHDRANMFATIFFAALDPHTGDLEYINAGHNPPLIVRDARVRAQLTRTGAAVGMFQGVTFRVETTRLERGDILLAYTDGVTDAPNARGKDFSDERLLALAQARYATASAMLTAIGAALHQHTEGAEPFDDVTMLAVRRE